MQHANSKKTHCKNGHEFTEENTRYTKQGWRACKECHRICDRKLRLTPEKIADNKKRSKEWRVLNPEKSTNSALRQYDKVRQVIEAAKNVPCHDCGVKYPHYVMDFDHRDKTDKVLNVGRTRSLSATIKEMEKCDIVCANCHRERTWKNVKRKINSKMDGNSNEHKESGQEHQQP